MRSVKTYLSFENIKYEGVLLSFNAEVLSQQETIHDYTGVNPPEDNIQVTGVEVTDWETYRENGDEVASSVLPNGEANELPKLVEWCEEYVREQVDGCHVELCD